MTLAWANVAIYVEQRADGLRSLGWHLAWSLAVLVVAITALYWWLTQPIQVEPKPPDMDIITYLAGVEPTNKNQPPSGVNYSDLAEFGVLIGVLIAFGIAAGLLYAAYGDLDSAGWLPHWEQSVITAQPNWLVGESKDCISSPLDGRSAHTLNRAKGYAISQISCDGGPEHSVGIQFFGRIEQPERTWVSWRCKRNEASFTCKQTGSSPPVMTGTNRRTGRPVVSYDDGKTWKWADQR
jgi:hypothetical protein